MLLETQEQTVQEGKLEEEALDRLSQEKDGAELQQVVQELLEQVILEVLVEQELA